MSIPIIDSLKAENWLNLTHAERIDALRQMEDSLALQENRPACSVGEIPEDDRQLDDNGQPILRGQHYTDELGDGHIELDPNLIDNDEPYQAVETYFHEARHAYQEHVAIHPEMHTEDPAKVADWEKNLGDGYMDESYAGFSYYRWQPVEEDSKQIARARTDEVYQDSFQDEGQYPAYQTEKQHEIAGEMALAQTELGENYQEEARQAMLTKYETEQALKAENTSEQDYYQGYGL
jgi:hypothetical protein